MLAAERGDEDELDHMTSFVEQMADPRHFAVYRRADVGFHLAVAEASRAPRLISAMTDVQREMTELIAHIAHPPAGPRRTPTPSTSAWSRRCGAATRAARSR